MHLRAAVKFYIHWLYLLTLLRNALIVATIAIIQAYNHSGGQPNWPLIYMIGGLAFAESLIEHIGNAKFYALLQLIWQALQALNPSHLQQILATVQALSPQSSKQQRSLTDVPRNPYDPRS